MTAEHPFAATLRQMKEHGFAKLNEQQKWEWHADVYAFRRVILSAPAVDSTPPDFDRKWFNEHLVGIAERYYRAKHAEQARVCRTSTEADNAIRFADAERWRNSPEGKEFMLGTRRKQRVVRHEDYDLVATEMWNERRAAE